MATHGGHLSGTAFLYSDAPEGAYLGAGIVAGQRVTLPLHSEIAPTALAGVLLGLPGGHLLVQLLGPLMWVTAVGLLCAAVRQVGGWWPLTLVTGLAASPIVLWTALWPTAHAFSLVGAAAASLAIVRVATGRLTFAGTLLAAGAAGL